MRAVVTESTGPPEVLRVAEVAAREPAAAHSARIKCICTTASVLEELLDRVEQRLNNAANM